MGKAFQFLLIMAMALYENSLDWQGMGNMSQDNMTVIRGYINANFSSSWLMRTVTATNDKTLVNFATSLSDELNRRWAPAWNVFSNFDTVLYGYAFRDHWFWLNGWKMNDGYYVSFIIWKDYNCIKWYTYDSNDQSQLYVSYDQQNSLLSTIDEILSISVHASSQTDIWGAAKTLGEAFVTNTSTSSFGWTVIASQTPDYLLNGYGSFCAKDYYRTQYVGGGQGTSIWGSGFIIQTR